MIGEIQREPFSGIGKPEPLKGELSGYWSRRIDDEHRLVYRADSKEAKILKAPITTVIERTIRYALAADSAPRRWIALRADGAEIGLMHLGGQMTKYTSDGAPFGADSPFFRIIREGLEGLAEGDDYFDLLADDVVFEYVISVPGYPGRVEGRQNVIDLYSGYGDFITMQTADNLRVYRDPQASVVVLEYQVHGESVRTGRPYDNRFVSIITIKDGKVTHWRDYLDPVAVFEATGWPNADQRGGLSVASPHLPSGEADGIGSAF